jgi:hypothetical protein
MACDMPASRSQYLVEAVAVWNIAPHKKAGAGTRGSLRQHVVGVAHKVTMAENHDAGRFGRRPWPPAPESRHTVGKFSEGTRALLEPDRHAIVH